MILYYFSFYGMPGSATHNLQVVNMCTAFAKRPDLDVRLITPFQLSSRLAGLETDFWKHYEVERNFKVIIPLSNSGILKKVNILFNLYKLIAPTITLIKHYYSCSSQFVIYSRSYKIGRIIKILNHIKKNPHFSGFFCEVHTLFNKLEYLSIANGLISISETLASDIKKSNLKKCPEILVVHDGVDLERYQTENRLKKWRKEIKLPEDRLIIGYTGQVSINKGGKLLLEAFRSIKNQEAILLLVGKILDKEIEDYYENENPDNVILTGYVPPALIYKYQLSSDILVLPSTRSLPYNRYTSPLKLFEYMAAGNPIIAAGLPGIKEVIRDGYNGVLFEPGNKEELGQKIEYLIEHKKIGKQMGKNAMIEAQDYSWDNRAEKIIDFIKLHTNQE